MLAINVCLWWTNQVQTLFNVMKQAYSLKDTYDSFCEEIAHLSGGVYSAAPFKSSFRAMEKMMFVHPSEVGFAVSSARPSAFLCFIGAVPAACTINIYCAVIGAPRSPDSIM